MFGLLRSLRSGLSDLNIMQKRNYIFFLSLYSPTVKLSSHFLLTDCTRPYKPPPCPFNFTPHPGSRDRGSSYRSPGMCRMKNIALGIRLHRQINVRALFAELKKQHVYRRLPHQGHKHFTCIF